MILLFSWMGIIEQGGVLWNRDNLFDEYFKNIIPEILPNGIVLNTVDNIYDEKWRSHNSRRRCRR